MPTDLAADAVRTAEAFGLMAAVAVPAGAAAWGVGRLGGRSVLPRWGVSRAGWTALDAVMLFGLNLTLPLVLAAVLSAAGLFAAVYGPDFPPFTPGTPATAGLGAVGGGLAAAGAERATAANYLRLLWGMALSAPLVGAAAVGLWAVGNGRLPTVKVSRVFEHVALGVGGWLVLTPAVLALNAATTWASEAAGVVPDPHPLTRVELTGATVALFGAVVCGLIPLVEELIFRGVLLPWTARRRDRPRLVLAVGALWAAISMWPAIPGSGFIGFVVALGAGLAVVPLLPHPRTAGSVYATAAAFALVHANVWPTPVPLFPLGLGLGYLAARTRGILAPAVAHGLFNAVSFVILLRGGAGAV